MTLLYEANPPKIDGAKGGAMERFMERLCNVSEVCGGVHITENVLGMRRASPILAGRRLRSVMPDIPMSLTMRVRNKDSASIEAFAHDAADTGFTGMLVVAGDPAPNAPDSGQVPSRVVRRLVRNGTVPGMDLYLSISTDPDYATMASKLAARPKGFITQVIQRPEQAERIVAALPEYEIIPIVLYPSPKNKKAADFLGLDMGAYSDGFDALVCRIHDAAGRVLLTSPGDFDGLREFLSKNRY